MLVRHIEALQEAVKRTRAERPFHIDAWVVLSDSGCQTIIIDCPLTSVKRTLGFSNESAL